jgi:hypothetical protein
LRRSKKPLAWTRLKQSEPEGIFSDTSSASPVKNPSDVPMSGGINAAMSSATVFTPEQSETASRVTATTPSAAKLMAVWRPHVMPYRAAKLAQLERTSRHWTATIVVSALLAALVLSAVAAAVAR